MRVSIPCPAAIHANQTILLNDGELAYINVDGGLLTAVIPGTSFEEKLQVLRDSEATVGAWIADCNSAEEIHALGQLKGAIVEFQRTVQRESVYASREENYLTRAAELVAAEVSEASAALDVSQLHTQQHAFSDDSSEQQIAATNIETNEEIGNESQKEQGQDRLTGIDAQ